MHKRDNVAHVVTHKSFDLLAVWDKSAPVLRMKG